MKLIIDGYEVEIKARATHKSRANKEDTLAFLNTIALWAGEAVSKWDRDGCHAIAESAREDWRTIHNVCEAGGLYKGF